MNCRENPTMHFELCACLRFEPGLRYRPRNGRTKRCSEKVPRADHAGTERVGMVKSLAGRDGGFILGRPADQITMGQVVRHFDGL